MKSWKVILKEFLKPCSGQTQLSPGRAPACEGPLASWDPAVWEAAAAGGSESRSPTPACGQVDAQVFRVRVWAGRPSACWPLALAEEPEEPKGPGSGGGGGQPQHHLQEASVCGCPSE